MCNEYSLESNGSVDEWGDGEVLRSSENLVIEG